METQIIAAILAAFGSGGLIGGAVVWTIKRLVNGTLQQNQQLVELATDGMRANTEAMEQLAARIETNAKVQEERHRATRETLARIERKV